MGCGAAEAWPCLLRDTRWQRLQRGEEEFFPLVPSGPWESKTSASTLPSAGPLGTGEADTVGDWGSRHSTGLLEEEEAMAALPWGSGSRRLR